MRYIIDAGSAAGTLSKWKYVLAVTNGVYVLVYHQSQTQYIGSATAKNAFLRRWSEYKTSRHSGNILLKKLKYPEFEIGILKTCASSDTPSTIITREQDWKHKLGSRAFGTNGN